MSATAVSADTLDLLITAALRYGILASRTRVAFSPTAGVLQATPSDAGRMLLQQHLAAQACVSSRPAPLPGELRCYQHVPVPHVDPVHVLKALHTYEDVAATGPGWPTSTARTLTNALLRAATQALPGYTDAPSSWRRPSVRSGTPIGLAHQWRPIGDGVVWMTPRELAAHWDSAALVVVTVPALPDVPVGLSPRTGVYVVAGGPVSEAEWQRVAVGPSPVLVELPAGEGWLREELTAVAAGASPATLTALW